MVGRFTGPEAYYHRTTHFNVSVGDIPVLLFADSGLDSRSRRHLGFGGRSRADGQRVHIQARQATAVMEIYAVHVFARRVRKKKKKSEKKRFQRKNRFTILTFIGL